MRGRSVTNHAHPVQAGGVNHAAGGEALGRDEQDHESPDYRRKRTGIQEEVRYSGEIRGFGRLADQAGESQTGRTLGTNEYVGRLSEGIMSGTVNGTMVLGSETVSFKASGLAKMVKRSPVGAAQ